MEWFRREADEETARRFLEAAREAIVQLADAPGLGATAEARSRRLADAHRWRVPGFSNRLIFYRSTPSSIVILRVLHASRDWKLV